MSKKTPFDQFPSLRDSMGRFISAAQAGSKQAKNQLNEFVTAVIDEYDMTWLDFLVIGVVHYWENNLNSHRSEAGFIKSVTDARGACFEEAPDRITKLRAKLHESRSKFGTSLTLLWSEALAKAMEARNLDTVEMNEEGDVVAGDQVPSEPYLGGEETEEIFGDDEEDDEGDLADDEEIALDDSEEKDFD